MFFFNNNISGIYTKSDISRVNNISKLNKQYKNIFLATNEEKSEEYYETNEFIIYCKGYIIQDEKFSNTDCLKNIYELYMEYKEEFINKIDGLFNCIIIDKKEKKIIMYGDRLGFYPIFYSKDKDIFFWGSSIKEILKYKTTPGNLNIKQCLNDFINLFNIQEETHVENIFRVRPGEYLVYHNSILSKKKYYDINENLNCISEDEAITKINTQLKKIAKTHLTSNSAVLISGGLDSSSICSLISKLDNNIQGFTFVTAGNNGDVYHSKIVSEYCNINHNFIYFPESEENPVKKITELVTILERPFWFTKLYANLITYRKIKSENINYLYTGLLNDELLAKYIDAEYFNIMRDPSEYSLYYDIENYIKNFNKATGDIFSNNIINKIDIKEYANNHFKKIYSNFKSNDIINQQAYYLMKTIGWFASEVEGKVGENAGVNLIHPLCDKEYCDLIASLPGIFKIGSKDKRLSKYIYRKALFDILPESVVYRTTSDVGPEVFTWLNPNTIFMQVFNENKEFFKEILDEKLYKNILDGFILIKWEYCMLLSTICIFVKEFNLNIKI